MEILGRGPRDDDDISREVRELKIDGVRACSITMIHSEKDLT